MAERTPITILDGPTGTELIGRGVELPDGAWSAAGIDAHAHTLAQIHADYAAAGATVHTACTFRTTERAVGHGWKRLAKRAVEICRESVPADHLVGGSIAPLEDCYRPDLSPSDAESEHARLAGVLAEAGCDLLLCETFPHVGEALAALRAAAHTGLETWVSFTAGFRGDLLSPREVADGARRAIDAGANAVLINCVPPETTLAYVEALARAADGATPFGAYANAGTDAQGRPGGAEHISQADYAQLVGVWIDAGATIVGGCCGAGPEHIRAVAEWVHQKNGPA